MGLNIFWHCPFNYIAKTIQTCSLLIYCTFEQRDFLICCVNIVFTYTLGGLSVMTFVRIWCLSVIIYLSSSYICRLWRLSHYDVFCMMTFVALWRLSPVMTFVACGVCRSIFSYRPRSRGRRTRCWRPWSWCRGSSTTRIYFSTAAPFHSSSPPTQVGATWGRRFRHRNNIFLIATRTQIYTGIL